MVKEKDVAKMISALDEAITKFCDDGLKIIAAAVDELMPVLRLNLFWPGRQRTKY
jgi:hypothetical protein